MSGVGVLFAIVPDALVRLFTSDRDVIVLGGQLVIIAAFFQLFDGLQAVAGGALRGAGDVRFPSVATALAHWAVGFPAALLLAFSCGLGVRGIWWGLASGLVTISVLLVGRFLRITRGTIARV